jgi:hypothetical protein
MPHLRPSVCQMDELQSPGRQKPGHDPGSVPCILTADGLRVWLCWPGSTPAWSVFQSQRPLLSDPYLSTTNTKRKVRVSIHAAAASAPYTKGASRRKRLVRGSGKEGDTPIQLYPTHIGCGRFIHTAYRSHPTPPNAAEQATRRTKPPRHPTCIDASAALSEQPVPEPWRQAGCDSRRDGLPEFAPKDRQETRCDLLNHPREISARKFPTITAFVTIFRRAHLDIGCLVVISTAFNQRALM